MKVRDLVENDDGSINVVIDDLTESDFIHFCRLGIETSLLNGIKYSKENLTPGVSSYTDDDEQPPPELFAELHGYKDVS